MLSYYFKQEEKKLEDTCEFVEFDKKAFGMLDIELNQLLADMRKSIRIEAMGLTAAKMLKKFQKLLPLPMSEKEMEALMGVLKHLFSLAQCTQKDAENVSRLMYTYCATLIPGLQKIVKSRPQWFLPKSKSHSKSLPIVRVMVDDNAEFVIARELNEAVNVYQKVVCASPEAGYVDVMEMNVALKIWETYGRTLDDIEFIVVPIIRTKHCFTPIPNGAGLWCKPSADVLIELLKELFFGSNVFQAPSKKTSETLMYLFDAMSTLMKPDMEEIYLLDNRMIDHIDLLFAQKIQRNNAPKTIRDVGSKGFTAEDVRQELKLLKVDSFFPDVCQHADVVFEKIQKAKRLRTCDMYDAVENCMQLSFFKLLPDFAKFLHCQKACHRVYGLKCDQCDQEKKNPKVQKHYMTFWAQKEDGSRGDKVIKMEILNDKGTEIIVQNIPEPAEAKEEEQDENKDETIQKLTDKMRAVTVVTKSGSSPMKPSSGASTSSEK
ncbi:hypothetical protein B9Z55_007357 [Caenorhabditis nigoni]|nr:hypothetical protein B9Z55_007357 [Caenorhabditis nigoni]